MLLAIDIGNTNITLGCYKNGELLFVSRLFSLRHKSSDEFAINLYDIFRLYNVQTDSFSGAIIGSVVPELTDALARAVETVTNIKPLIVGEQYNGELKIDVLPVSQLGADLIAGSIGAIEKYPLPCIVADLGTATKLIVVDENGYFIGCTISPGVKISLDALAKNASLLPSINFAKPEKVIGSNSVDCMQSGIVFGTASMLDGLSKRIINETGFKNATLIATGGYSKGIIPCCEQSFIYDENLILDGLKVIYEKAKQ